MWSWPPIEQSELVWDYFDWLGSGAMVLAILIFLSALDDLVIDGTYWLWRLRLKVQGRPEYPPYSLDALCALKERPIALMVPAWQESGIIGRMIARASATLDYRDYRVFVGVYPNDPATVAEVRAAAARFPFVIPVMLPHDGPTCKADCLNHIVARIAAHEAQTGIAFAGCVLHDSEDVLHPLELKFLNGLLLRHDLIQLPVVAIERRWWDLVSGSYMDEFAEWHSKELLVRERMTGSVPSAGVGTCFSGRAMRLLSEETGGRPFNDATLTEDYDIAERLARGGLNATLALFPVAYEARRHGFGRKGKAVAVNLPICVREYFPNAFRASYRQKARWTLGIAIQGWAQLGWRGTLAANYFLFRDRKVLVTAFASVAAYFLILNIALLALMVETGLWHGPAPDIYHPAGWFGWLITANVVALGLRLVQRAYFVSRLHGWQNGLLCVPRLIVGTFVNAAATGRAIRLYLGSIWFGTKLVWDKTAHDFPGTPEPLPEPTLAPVQVPSPAMAPQEPKLVAAQ